MRELFARSYSSVYVHYVSLAGFSGLGTTLIIHQQTLRLAQRIRDDSARVQVEKSDAWTRFDTRQLPHVVDYVFGHLASGTTGPFDFCQCRHQLDIPESAEVGISEFLRHCLQGDAEGKFDSTAAVLSSTILRRYLCIPDIGEWHMLPTYAQMVWIPLDF